MRLLLIPDATAPNGVDGFCAALAKRAPQRGHHCAIEPILNGPVEGALKKISAPGFAAEADVVLVNSVQPSALEACRASGRRTALRLVDSFAGWTAREADEHRRLALQADLILVPSRFLGGLVEAWGAPAGKVHLAPYAYEHIMAQQIAVVTVRSQHHKSFSLVAGGDFNEATQPGFETLLSAVARLRLDGHLFLFGDGPALGALKERVAQLVISDRVTFAGKIPHAKIMEHLRSAKAYIDPCGVDGFPMYVLHALSEGCPVVAARNGPLTEIIRDGENGFLFAPGNALGLSEAIVTLSSVKGLSLKLIEGGIKTVERHSWEATADAALDALEAMPS